MYSSYSTQSGHSSKSGTSHPDSLQIKTQQPSEKKQSAIDRSTAKGSKTNPTTPHASPLQPLSSSAATSRSRSGVKPQKSVARTPENKATQVFLKQEKKLTAPAAFVAFDEDVDLLVQALSWVKHQYDNWQAMAQCGQKIALEEEADLWLPLAEQAICNPNLRKAAGIKKNTMALLCFIGTQQSQRLSLKAPQGAAAESPQHGKIQDKIQTSGPSTPGTPSSGAIQQKGGKTRNEKETRSKANSTFNKATITAVEAKPLETQSNNTEKTMAAQPSSSVLSKSSKKYLHASREPRTIAHLRQHHPYLFDDVTHVLSQNKRYKKMYHDAITMVHETLSQSPQGSAPLLPVKILCLADYALQHKNWGRYFKIEKSSQPDTQTLRAFIQEQLERYPGLALKMQDDKHLTRQTRFLGYEEVQALLQTIPEHEKIYIHRSVLSERYSASYDNLSELWNAPGRKHILSIALLGDHYVAVHTRRRVDPSGVSWECRIYDPYSIAGKSTLEAQLRNKLGTPHVSVNVTHLDHQGMLGDATSNACGPFCLDMLQALTDWLASAPSVPVSQLMMNVSAAWKRLGYMGVSDDEKRECQQHATFRVQMLRAQALEKMADAFD